MKIQILISKSSWANIHKKTILKKLKTISKDVFFIQNHKKIKNHFDINIIFSYFKIIPKKYLKKSKINLIPHESDLPKGKGMSPLTWQILEGKRKIFFSLIEANSKIDNGQIYFKHSKIINKNLIFEEIKKIQLDENIKLILKFLKYYKKNNKAPKKISQIGHSTFYKKRTPQNSEINIKNSILSQFNLLRVVDNKNYPAFFKIYGKKYILRISKS